jgi:hypothetical protein
MSWTGTSLGLEKEVDWILDGKDEEESPDSSLLRRKLP